jgi:hypothetical protein
MYAGELIGKLAIRTAPVDRGEREVGYSGVVTRCLDNSFTDSPIIILAATESHIVFKYDSNHDPILDDGKRQVLNYEYCDDNWTSWDDLMSLADEKNIELLRKLQE